MVWARRLLETAKEDLRALISRPVSYCLLLKMLVDNGRPPLTKT